MRFIFAIAACLFVSSAEASYHTTAPATAKITPVTVTVKKSQAKKHIPLPRTLKPLARMDMDEDDDNYRDDIDLQVSYRKPDLVDNSELPLSDYVRLRLAHARRLALEEYRRIWG
jgi:hypothetical protein